ncbi:PnbA Carboxylesterase type B [Pyrenophora tritici-repentis]|nr:PnbA Carboxylesterase type B [Pyrenophora tritici-repentis]
MLYLATAAALMGAVYAQNSSLPTIDLGYEIYRASGFNDSGNFYNFSNIRYAAPPVGNLRFAPPQAPAVNRSAVNNGDAARICPQANPAWNAVAARALAREVLGVPPLNMTYTAPGANASSPIPTPDPRESEDCLFLDVFVPEDVLDNVGKGYGAPVLVWIYGGGYTGGSKNNNPAGLLAASGNSTNGDIIYVALNYRLGAMGWSSGPSYNEEGGVSNLGLYDQRFALEWVQENIHLFGGDKNRVTVFGESAGGGSIMHQITAYGGANGSAPFQQAVPQSPGWQPMNSADAQEDTYQKFLKLANATSLAELRALPSEDIIRASAQQVIFDSQYGGFSYGPVVDGLFVPLQPGRLLAQGRFDQDVRVMVGHNANEGALFTPAFIPNDTVLESQLSGSFVNIPKKFLNYITKTLYPPVFDGTYGYKSQFERGSLIVAEGVFTCNTEYLSRAYGNSTYSYLFSVPPAIHGMDVPYTYFPGGAATEQVANVTVAVALQNFIASFAETGVPDAKGVKQFNMYGANARVIELGIKGIEEIRDSNANARCAWWQKALY